jgi:hypothetical protein
MNKQLDCLKRNPSLLLQTQELVLYSYAKTIAEAITWVSSVKMSDMVSPLASMTVKSLILRNIPLLPEISKTWSNVDHLANIRYLKIEDTDYHLNHPRDSNLIGLLESLSYLEVLELMIENGTSFHQHIPEIRPFSSHISSRLRTLKVYIVTSQMRVKRASHYLICIMDELIRLVRRIISGLGMVPAENLVSMDEYESLLQELRYEDFELEDISANVYPGFFAFLSPRGVGWRAFTIGDEKSGIRFVIVTASAPARVN